MSSHTHHAVLKQEAGVGPGSAAPGLLSAEQVARFWREGFLACPEVFSPEQVRRLREAVEAQQVNQAYKTARETIHQLALIPQDPAFAAMARDERIVQRLMPLIGPDIQVQHSKLAAKPLARGQGPFGWHQDFAYFPHTNTDLVAVMVYLDDTDQHNGCMSMLRGSHRLGLLNHSGADGYFTGRCQEESPWTQHPDRVVPLELPAGSISLHHCLTLHGSPANQSARPRRSLVVQYRAADAYQLADTIFPDTGMVVAGQRRPVARCTVGSVPLPKFRGRGAFGHGTAWNQVGEFAGEEKGT